jgi:hypothetical protein
MPGKSGEITQIWPPICQLLGFFNSHNTRMLGENPPQIARALGGSASVSVRGLTALRRFVAGNFSMRKRYNSKKLHFLVPIIFI